MDVETYDDLWDEGPTGEPIRPAGLSNHAWALHQLGYPIPEVHWGWTRQYARKP